MEIPDHQLFLGHFEAAKALIELGANVNLPDKQKKTALIHAAKNGHLLIVSLLLKNGAKAKAVDSSTNSAVCFVFSEH